MPWMWVTQGSIHERGVNVGGAKVIKIFNSLVELAGGVVFLVERDVRCYHELLLCWNIYKITRLVKRVGSTNIDTFLPARHDH